jgi:hypothetical protein
MKLSTFLQGLAAFVYLGCLGACDGSGPSARPACEEVLAQALATADTSPDWRGVLDSIAAVAPGDSVVEAAIRFEETINDSLLEANGAVVTYRFHTLPAVGALVQVQGAVRIAEHPSVRYLSVQVPYNALDGCTP